MTPQERKVIELALEALTHIRPNALTSFYTIGDRDKAITAMKELLAQPEQSNTCGEPDWKGLVLSHNEDCESRCDMDRCGYKPYYEYSKRRCPDCPVHEKIWVDDTTPPQRKPLTDDQIAEMWLEILGSTPPSGIHEDGLQPWRFVRAIEAAHGIKE